MSLSRGMVAFVTGLVLACSGLVRAEDAVQKDRQLYAGKWQVVGLEINGNKASEEDAKKITVVNKEDGAWVVEAEGKVVARGTSKIDATKKPKTIDITVTEGDAKGQTALGVYEVHKDSRKLCVAESGKPRPTEFSSKPGSGHTLVTFKRVKP